MNYMMDMIKHRIIVIRPLQKISMLVYKSFLQPYFIVTNWVTYRVLQYLKENLNFINLNI